MAISNSASGFRPGVCTSTTRPTAPYEGQTIYETDTDKMLVWNGSAWRFMSTPQSTEPGTWISYTNIGLTQPGSVGPVSIVYSKYTVINKVVTWVASINIPSGSAGISGNRITVNTLPITAANAGSIMGVWYYLESGVQHRAGTALSDTATTNFQLVFDGGGNYFGSSYAVKAGDNLRFSVTWEIA